MGLYVIANETEGSLKIGISQDIDRRFKQINNMNAGNMVLLYRVDTLGKEEEKFLHDYLKTKGKHLHHEWFKLDIETIGFLPSALVRLKLCRQEFDELPSRKRKGKKPFNEWSVDREWAERYCPLAFSAIESIYGTGLRD